MPAWRWGLPVAAVGAAALMVRQGRRVELPSPIPGMEGPFVYRSGIILYWDPREGKYYDRSSDMYLSDDEVMAHMQARQWDPGMEAEFRVAGAARGRRVPRDQEVEAMVYTIGNPKMGAIFEMTVLRSIVATKRTGAKLVESYLDPVVMRDHGVKVRFNRVARMPYHRVGIKSLADASKASASGRWYQRTKGRKATKGYVVVMIENFPSGGYTVSTERGGGESAGEAIDFNTKREAESYARETAKSYRYAGYNVDISDTTARGRRSRSRATKFTVGDILILDSPHSRGILPPSEVNYRGLHQGKAIVVVDGMQRSVPLEWLSKKKGTRAKGRKNNEEVLRSSFGLGYGGTKIFLTYDRATGQYVVRSRFQDFYRSRKGLKPNSAKARAALKRAEDRFEQTLLFEPGGTDWEGQQAKGRGAGKTPSTGWTWGTRKKHVPQLQDPGPSGGSRYNKRVRKCISGKVKGEGWSQRQAIAACLSMDRDKRLRADGSYRSAGGRRAMVRARKVRPEALLAEPITEDQATELWRLMAYQVAVYMPERHDDLLRKGWLQHYDSTPGNESVEFSEVVYGLVKRRAPLMQNWGTFKKGVTRKRSRR